MQNPKTSPSEPKPTRKLKTLVSDGRSHKVGDRKSPRVVYTERKKPSEDSELESQLVHLQEEYKKANDQLRSSEFLKIRYQQEVEEAKKKLLVMSAKLQETEKQLDEVSESEDARVQELRKISHDRDKAWQSELEAMQKQHNMDSTALASAMNEIHRLKTRIFQWEASQAGQAEAADAEICSLRAELHETVVLVRKLEVQLNDRRESEARAIEVARVAQEQLDAIKTSEETLGLEFAKALETNSSLLLELEDSKNRVRSLEEHSAELKGDQSSSKISSFESETSFLKDEVSRLRASLKEAERMYQEAYTQSTLEIKNAYEFVEQLKSAYNVEDAKSKAKINESLAEVEELRKKLMEAENTLKGNFGERDSELELKLMNSELCLENLSASLIEKEVQLQVILEQNTNLKSDIMKSEAERNKANEMITALADAEEKSLAKLGSLAEEVGSRKAELIAEQVHAAQTSNAEMEAELRRLKVQCDQWRKAAEVAAAMLSASNSGKSVERASSFNHHSLGRGLNSPQFEDTDEDSPKKRNNMLKKITVLLKKGQK